MNREKRAAPLWAALGAPFLGVPMLVGLLALVSPVERATVQDAEPVRVEEQSELHPASRVVPDEPCTLEELHRG